MRILTVAAASLVGATACQSPSKPVDRRPFDFLMTLETVDSAHIGAIGNLSMPARAFRLVLERKDAEAAFTTLSTDAKPGGRLVALCGLKVMRSARYPAALEAARGLGGDVEGMQGCLVGMTRPVAEVIRDIETGTLCESYQGVDEAPETRARYRAEPFPPS